MPALIDKETKPKILVVDDEPHQRTIMDEAIKSLGYQVTVVETPMQALEKARYDDFDILVTDMQMPDMDGIKLLEAIMGHNLPISVILATAHGSIETAVEAMKKGAADYLLKPVEFGALDIALKRVLERRALMRENRRLQCENEVLKRDIGIRYHLTNTIGKSELAQKLQAKIQHFMKNKAPVLVLGEVGAGKSSIARMIHYNSPWAKNDLISFDCAAVPDELQELHLFGQELTQEAGVKIPARPGLVEKAHMGTLVISNIHKLNKQCQPRLSKVLREEKTQRVAGRQFYHTYVRVIVTAQRLDFEKAVEDGNFRRDLFDLLNENTVEVPSLRQRSEDIPVLIAATAKRFGQYLGKEITKIDQAVIEKLSKYDFPGNMGELESMVETAVIRCTDSVLKLEHFTALSQIKG